MKHLSTITDLVNAGMQCARSIQDLEPLGGPGAIVKTPTYADTKTGPKSTSHHSRFVDGFNTVDALGNVGPVACAMLNMPAAQTNRIEECLVPTGIPRIQTTVEGMEISSLVLPQRGVSQHLITCEDYPEGLLESKSREQMFAYCAGTATFGVFHSITKQALSLKWAKPYVSEIVAIGAERAVASVSRLDPCPISAASKVFVSKDKTWTSEKRTGAKAEKPSVVQLGNHTPTIELSTSSITSQAIRQLSSLSLAPLRKDCKDEGIVACMVAIVLAGAELANRNLYLRSGCELVASEPLVWNTYGGKPTEYRCEDPLALLEEVTELASRKFGWKGTTILKKPSAGLVKLIQEGMAAQVETADEKSGGGADE